MCRSVASMLRIFSHSRTLHRLVGGLLCAASFCCAPRCVMAGFLLFGDEAAITEVGAATEQRPHRTTQNLAAYLPAPRERQRIDLSVATKSGPAPTERTGHQPTRKTSATTDGSAWLTAHASNSASQAAGSSNSTGQMSAGTPAALSSISQSYTDLQVTSWRQDDSHLNLPKSVPRTLLRPPQA